MKFKMKQRVRIVGHPRTDGSTDVGVIIGIELRNGGGYLGFMTVASFESSFTIEHYKVAYINDVTNKLCQEWFESAELEKLGRTKK